MQEDALTMELGKKLGILKEIIGQYKKPCVAFSGGVDSSLLLRAAVDVLGNAVIPITVNGGMMPRSEFAEAKELANAFGVELQIMNVDVFALPEFVENDDERCYYCKKNIFTQIKGRAEELGCDVIFDGSNLDDQSDYRPGLRALEEMKVVSPLTDAQLTKENIRAISRAYGLPTADKPAMACLATRIPAGETVTEEKLLKIEQGEEVLKTLKMSQYRLRYIGNMAKIECPVSDFAKLLENREILVRELKAIGFKAVTLDLSGYQCGSMNGVEN